MVSSFNATSEDEFKLFEENGTFFIRAGNRVGPYREFVRMLFDDDDIVAALLSGDVRAKFYVLMEGLCLRWNDDLRADIFCDK